MRTTKMFLLSIIAGLTLSAACAVAHADPAPLRNRPGAICDAYGCVNPDYVRKAKALARKADPFEKMPASLIVDIPAPKPTTSNAFVDEIDGDEARILIDSDLMHAFVIPTDMLPEGTHEGSRIWIMISR